MISTEDLQCALVLIACYSEGAEYVVPCATWLRDPGMFYFGTREAFVLEVPLTFAKLMPIDPARECDINTMYDWYLAEEMYTELHKEKA